MKNRLVYDLPLRIFHWLFAGLFVGAFLIAKTVDDESLTFSYHMLGGLLLGFIVILRVLWGFVGTKYSRFSSFALNPKDLTSYFTSFLAADKERWAGHNPASSWAGLLMMGLALGLAGTGYLMAGGRTEVFEDLHELLANIFLVVVLMHIMGVLLHAFRHRDGLALSMVNGRKKDIPEAERIPGSRPLIALLFVAFVTLFGFHLAHNFDSQSRNLKLLGTNLQLGENESDNEGKHDYD